MYHIMHKAFLACTIIGSTPSVLGRLLCPSQQARCMLTRVESLANGLDHPISWVSIFFFSRNELAVQEVVVIVPVVCFFLRGFE
jgi:hypothetical protein